MTAVAVDQIARPEPKRDRWGRYLIPTPDGNITAHTRATTVAETIDDRYNLEKWKMRQVARGIGIRADLYALAASHDPDNDRRTYDDLCDKALEASKSTAAAGEGTALHRFTERLDTGAITLDDIPEQWRPTCELYQRRLDQHKVTVDSAGIERIVVDDNYRVAGTSDRLPVIFADGRRLVGDLKTGKDLQWSWLAISIQLAIYANHTATYDPATGERGPRIDVDRETGLVIHLPATGPIAGSCTLYTVDLTAGYDAYLTALTVRAHRKASKSLATEIDLGAFTPPPTAVELGNWIRDRIRILAPNPAGVTDLRNRWPSSVPQPFPTEPTADQVDALAQVLDRVEALHEIPFGAPRPGQPTPRKTTST